jgi:hypothetical protein
MAMTLVFEEDPDGGPRIHAIVIGVGAYPELARLDDDMGLEARLASPPVSAHAFADFLINQIGPQGVPAPLGSIELLVSAADGAGPVEPATTDNIITALRRWHQRCDRDEGNLAIFYFCGHGVQAEVTALLAADFGADPQVPFLNALNLNGTVRAMASCAAHIQCWFADTCRTVPPGALTRIRVEHARVFREAERLQPHRDAPIGFATGFGQRAFGPRRGGVTRFTEALMAVLGGLGARPANGGWEVTTLSLGDAMTRTMRRLHPAAPQQACSFGGEASGGVIRELCGPPMVPTTISIRQRQATTAVDLSLVSAFDPAVAFKDHRAGSAWALEVPADSYWVNAAAANDGSSTYRGRMIAVPPEARHVVELAP